jgi:hypothetical protein
VLRHQVQETRGWQDALTTKQRLPLPHQNQESDRINQADTAQKRSAN